MIITKNIFKILLLIICIISKIYGDEAKSLWTNVYFTTGVEAYRHYKDTTNLIHSHSEVAPFLFGIGYDINKNHSFSLNFMDFDFLLEYSSAPLGTLFDENIGEKHELRNIDITYTYYFLNSPRGKWMFINEFTIENHNIDVHVHVAGLFYENNFHASVTAKNNMFKTGTGYRFFINPYMELSIYYLLGIYQKVDDNSYDALHALGAQIPPFERFIHFVKVNLIWSF